MCKTFLNHQNLVILRACTTGWGLRPTNLHLISSNAAKALVFKYLQSFQNWSFVLCWGVFRAFALFLTLFWSIFLLSLVTLLICALIDDVVVYLFLPLNSYSFTWEHLNDSRNVEFRSVTYPTEITNFRRWMSELNETKVCRWHFCSLFLYYSWTVLVSFHLVLPQCSSSGKFNACLKSKSIPTIDSL